MPRFHGVEYGFENQHKAERIPGQPTIVKNGPTPLDPWTDSNSRATGPKDADEYAADLKAYRWLAYILIGMAMAFYVGISWLMGWGVWR